MTGVINILAKIGLVIPIAGTVGGTYVAVSKALNSKSITHLNSVSQTEQQEQSSSTLSSSNSVERPNVTEQTQQESQASEQIHQETQKPEVSRSDVIQTISHETEQLEERVEGEEIAETTGNCTVTMELKKVIEELKLSDSDYIAVSCDGPDGSSHDTILTEKWTGIFPKKLLKRGNKFVQGKQLSIKTETDEPSDDDLEDIYTTRFHSSQFSTSDSVITGKWKYGETDYDDKKVDFVDLTSPTSGEKVYLVHVD